MGVFFCCNAGAQLRYKLISCDIFTREICTAAARSPHVTDIEFLPKGLHDIGCDKMRGQLEAVLSRVEESRYQAVLLGYGLCNNGIVGLRAGSIPLVIPRAHDCITLFLGSKERYHDYFFANTGTYFLTSGWIERGHVDGEIANQSVQRKMGMDQSYEELLEKYGEEDAKFLYEELQKALVHYHRVAYIEMGIEPDDRFIVESRRQAAEKEWEFEHLQGDMRLITQLVNGDWDPKDFLVVPPGHEVVPSYDEGVIGTRPVL